MRCERTPFGGLCGTPPKPIDGFAPLHEKGPGRYTSDTRTSALYLQSVTLSGKAIS